MSAFLGHPLFRQLTGVGLIKLFFVFNLLYNFVLSFAFQGADYVELDVQLSKDLVPIVFHDFYAAVTAKQVQVFS